MLSQPSIARWIRITFLGWTLGFALTLVFIGVCTAIGLGDAKIPLGLGMGAGVGIAQRRFINEYLGRAVSWPLVTALCLAMPFVSWDIARGMHRDVVMSIPWLVAAGGLLVGIVQWRLLRAHFTNVVLWIPASVIGWSAAGATVALDDRLPKKVPGVLGALIYIGVILVGGVLLGTATGVALRTMRRLSTTEG